MAERLRIGVVGGGISGLTAARILHGAHDLTVFEAEDVAGGHAHSLELPDRDGRQVTVDAGVCMFYSAGYQNFFKLLQQLKIPACRSNTSAEMYCIPDDQRYHG